jgi:hypothetical protein
VFEQSPRWRAAQAHGCIDARSVSNFKPHPLSEVSIGPKMAKKYRQHAESLNEDNRGEIEAYRLDRKWMSLDKTIPTLGEGW